MSPLLARSERCSALVLLILGLNACVYTGVRLDEVSPSADSVQFSGPVKADLVNGGTVLYRPGAYLVRDTLFGDGVRYDATLDHATPVRPLPRDSALSVVVFRSDVDAATSAVGSAAVAVAVVAVLVIVALSSLDFGDWGGCWILCP